MCLFTSQEHSDSTDSHSSSDAASQPAVDSLPRVGGHLNNSVLSEDAQRLVLSSWRQSTLGQYRSYIQKWSDYAVQRSLDPNTPTAESLANFLAFLFTQGLGYSALNTARSAVASLSISSDSLGNHPLVKRCIKGVFNERPAIPKNTAVWDPGIVLRHLKHKGDHKLLTLKQLSLSLATIMALLSGQSVQTSCS